MKPPTRRRMALQCPQASSASGHTRPGMCTAVTADPATFPCPVPWGRRTSGTAGHQIWRLQTIRDGAPCNGRDPCPHQMPMAGQVGSWGIHQDHLSLVKPPRSITTHLPKTLARKWQIVFVETGVEIHITFLAACKTSAMRGLHMYAAHQEIFVSLSYHTSLSH